MGSLDDEISLSAKKKAEKLRIARQKWVDENKSGPNDGKGNTIGGVIYVSPAREKIKSKNGGFPVDSVTINTFIPHNWISHPSGRIFSGDDRFWGKHESYTKTKYNEFGYPVVDYENNHKPVTYKAYRWINRRAKWNEFGSHRTQQRFYVIADKRSGSKNGRVPNAFPPRPSGQDGHGNNDVSVSIGETNKFCGRNSLNNSDVISGEAWQDSTPGPPLWIAKKSASRTELSMNSSYTASKIVKAICKCEAKNPLARGPSISYDIELIINRDDNTYSISGIHDGFPAYEIYINGVRVYEHDPFESGEGPMSLFGNGEHSILIKSKPIP